MNIWTLPGKKIIFKPEYNGSDLDRNYADNFLEIGKEYTVLKTRVGNFYTGVNLTDFPKLRFNSVLFVNVDNQTEEEDKTHPDWKIYNEE